MGFLPSNITALRKQEQLLSSAYTYIYGVAIDVVDADASGVADADADACGAYHCPLNGHSKFQMEYIVIQAAIWYVGQPVKLYCPLERKKLMFVDYFHSPSSAHSMEIMEQ